MPPTDLVFADLADRLRHLAKTRWIERALLLVGILCLGSYAYAWLDARVYEKLESRRLDAALAQRAAERSARTGTPAAEETDSFDSFRQGAGQAEGQPASEPSESFFANLQEGDLIGRIEVPRLGVSAIVLEGVGYRTLRRGVGHIPATALPDQAGNIGLAGHRDSFFRGLKDIRKDDIVDLTTPDGTYSYRVEWTKIVLPKDVDVLDGSGGPELTLVTCYPFYYVGSAPKRFIVRAVRVDQAADSSAPSVGQADSWSAPW